VENWKLFYFKYGPHGGVPCSDLHLFQRDSAIQAPEDSYDVRATKKNKYMVNSDQIIIINSSKHLV